MNRRIAIAGAGIIGMMVARQIHAQQPDADLFVIDRDLAGLGASARSVGLHFPLGRAARSRQMTRASQTFYERWRRERPDLPIRDVALNVHAPLGAERRVHEIFVDEAALQRAPSLERGGVPLEGYGRWCARGAQYADVLALVRTIAGDLRHVLHMREGVALDAISEIAGGVELQLSSGERIVADALILAPGPWALSPVFQPFTVDLGIRTKRIVAFHIDTPPERGAAAELFAEEDAFLLPVPEAGRWLYSYTCLEWDVDPQDPPFGITATHRSAAEAILARYMPHLADGLVNGRVFCDAYSPSGSPIVQPVGESGRIVFAGAANGSGYRLAPAISAEAADLVRDRFAMEAVR